MKRKIFSLAIVAVTALASVTAYAAPDRQGRVKKERSGRELGTCKVDSNCPKAFNPFDQLNLTADQKTRLEKLKTDRKAARDARIKEARTEGKVKRDSVSPEQRRQMMEQRRQARTQERAGYLKSVKEILTPEQYVEFLEITYTTAPTQAKAVRKDFKRDGKRDKARLGDRPGKKGPKDMKDRKDRKK